MTALALAESPDAERAAGHRLGIVAVLASTAFWSFGGSLGKATHVTGVVLSFWRMWIATGVITVVALVVRRRPTRVDVRRCLPMGVVFGCNICAFFITLQYVSIAVALIIGALTPVVALPIAVAFLGERVTALKLTCALAAVGGVVMAVLTAPNPSDGADTTIGYVWAVASLFIWVGYILMSKRVRRQVETVRMMWAVTFVGALTVSGIAAATKADLGSLHGIGWLWVTVLSVGPGLAGHGLFAWAQPRIDSSVSTVLIQAEPVGAALVAWVFLGQRMVLRQGIAMALVLAALGTLAYREARDDPTIIGEGRL